MNETSRRALRRTEVRDLYGASLHSIDGAIRKGHIRTTRYGSCVFLHPADCEKCFGFEEEVNVSAKTFDELRDLLA